MNTAPGLPQPSLDLLAQAALAPDPIAIAAWRTWREAHDINTTPWNEVRMLGAVAGRIDLLEPDSPIRPRLLGIRKFLWVQSQICLKSAIGGIGALNRAGIPVVLMKGAARIAHEPASAQERLIRDVDILVPLRSAQRAFEVLEGDGWSLVAVDWQTNLRGAAPIAGHHAWSLAKGKSEIDLHHFSNFLNRLEGDDDQLRKRSIAIEWRGVSVRIPSPADALMIALLHGVRWSQDAAADWTVDASAILDSGDVNWRHFLAEAWDRVVQTAALTGLTYLRETLRKPVPDKVIADLESQSTPAQRAELRQYSSTAMPKGADEVVNSYRMAVRRAIARSAIPLSAPNTAVAAKPMARHALKLRPRQYASLPLDLSRHDHSWIVVSAKIELPRSKRNEQMVGKFALVGTGLMLPKSPGTAQPTSGDGATRSFVIMIPSVLLRLRMIGELAFSFETKGSPDGLNVKIDVFHYP